MEIDRSWKCVYPAYINANRKKVEGRRITKEKAVADPKWQEIKDVLEANGQFEVMTEANKIYPRELDKELATSKGRVKYRLTTKDGQFEKRQEVLLYLAETIPKLKSRSKGAAPGTNPSGSQESQASGQGKKGKKGRK